jgi:outer membrane receptor protein involved in Fe transport
VLNITTPTAREVAGTKVTLGGGQLGTIRGDLRHAGVMGRGRWGYRVNAGYNSSDSWSRSRTSTDGNDLRREYGPVVDDSVKHKIPRAQELRPLNGQTAAVGTGTVSGDADPVKSMYGSARLDYYANNGSVVTGETGIAQVENELFVTGIGRVQVTKATRPYARLGWANKGFNVMAYWNGRRTKEPQYSLASGAPLLEHSDILHLEAQDIRTFDDAKGRVVFGGSARNYRVDTDSTLMRAADDHRSDYYYSVFGQIEYPLAEHFRMVGAARFDIGTLIGPQFSPKVALVFSPNDKHSLRFTVNRAFQTPNYSEFYLRAAAGAPANFTALETGLRASALGAATGRGAQRGAVHGPPPRCRSSPGATASSTWKPRSASRSATAANLSPSVYLTPRRLRQPDPELRHRPPARSEPGVRPPGTAPTAVPAAARPALVDAVRNALLANPASVTAGRG